MIIENATELKRPEPLPWVMRMKRHPGESYSDLFRRLHAPFFPYYNSWTYTEPMVITPERDQELQRMHQVLHRACCYYAAHYREYLSLIPHEERILRLLDHVSERPFRSGTARPDFLIDEAGRILLCEITSRFFGNGYFLSAFTEETGRTMAENAGITDRTERFEAMLAYFADMAGQKRRLCVLRSADKSDSIGLYVPFYSALGLEVRIYNACEVEDHLDELRDAFIVSALNQKDLLHFSDETLLQLSDLSMVNDFRTIFLLHDKRLFRLFGEPGFLNAALSKEDAAFLREHVIPTWLPDRDADRFAEARDDREGWILKHHCLGKSEMVYAGCLTEREEWEKLFISGAVEEMILQPFIQQRTYTALWNGANKPDYTAGTLLSVDDRYFGAGLFRTSARPVINQTDAHKIAPIVTGQGERLGRHFVL